MPTDLIACHKARTVVASESGRIQKSAERKLLDSTAWVLKIIRESKYEAGMGTNPRKLRLSHARPVKSGYRPMIVSGDETRAFPSTDCSGNPTTINASANRVANCDTPAGKVFLGYDEFGREAKENAIETEVICIKSMLEKYNPGEYLAMLREGLSKWAVEGFADELITDIIDLSKYKYSVDSSFGRQTGQNFSRLPHPQGMLNISYLRRVADHLDAEGFTKTTNTQIIDVRTSYQSATAAIEQHRLQRGIQIQAAVNTNDPIWGSVILYDRFRFITGDQAVRGYLKQVSATQYEFIRVYPTVNRAGEGGGIVQETNEDYYNCETNCGGTRYRLAELAFIVHPDAMTRQPVAVPTFGLGTASKKFYNFDPQVHNGNVIFDGEKLVRNESGFKFKIRIDHAYAPETVNPELMTVVMYWATPDFIQLPEILPCSPKPCPTDLDISIKKPAILAGVENCTGDSNPQPVLSGAGTIRVSTVSVSACPGSVVVQLERIGGNTGAITATIDTADGSATAPTDYTAIAGGTVTWADGVYGTKNVIVTVNNSAAEKTFDLTISSVSAGTLGEDTSTVTLLSAAQCCIESDEPPASPPALSAPVGSAAKKAAPAAPKTTPVGKPSGSPAPGAAPSVDLDLG